MAELKGRSAVTSPKTGRCERTCVHPGAARPAQALLPAHKYGKEMWTMPERLILHGLLEDPLDDHGGR